MRRTRSLMVSVGVIATTTCTAMAMMMTTAPAAQACNFYNQVDATLAAHTWTTNSCVGPLDGIYGEETYKGLAICVGPVQYRGGWVFPYGWDCSNSRGTVSWQFPTIEAAAGFDNPNSRATYAKVWGFGDYEYE